jgi:DNA-binding protein Fis
VVLAACGGTRTKAAIQLGINRNTLHKKIKDLRINE